MNVIGYARVSTQEQADSGAGLDAQRAAIVAEIGRRGWNLVRMIEDRGASGKSLRRPGLSEALDLVERGEANAIVVSKLDRLSRSVVDFAGLMQRAQERRWALVALDIQLDMTTPVGGLIANILASVAEWERKVIAARTRDALQAKRAQGVILGRPRRMTPNAVALVHELRADGLPLLTIAHELERREVPTPTGRGRWSTSGVRRALRYAA